jgi:hypothetical protein
MSIKIDNLVELESVLCNIEKTNEGVLGFFNKFKIDRISSITDNAKLKGFKANVLIISMCLFRFHGLSINAIQKLGVNYLCKADDNTFYRLMNNPLVQWRKLLLSFATQFITIVKNNTHTTKAIKCFVIDDTDIVKTGTKFEFISRVFNHVTRRCELGFKLLALGFWDGKSLIAVDFSLHREKGQRGNFGLSKEEKRNQFSKKRDDKSPAKTRVRELDIKKTEAAVSMIKRAVKHGIFASYVLMDSWFTNDYIIKSIRSIKNGLLHVLGMCKIDKRLYNVNGKELNALQITTKYERKNGHYSRKYKSYYISIVADYKGVKVKLFFIRYQSSQKWTLLLTTNLSLTFCDAIEIYQIRWTIEVMFKECKQYLRLGQSQNIDFDGQIADATLVFITHTILTLQKRFGAYETTGELFRESQQSLLELTLWQRILKTFISILENLLEILDIDIEQVIIKIMKDEKASTKLLTLLSIMQKENENSDLNTKMVA